MKKIKVFLAAALSSLAVTSCFDMAEHPFTLLDSSNYFTDEISIKQVIANIYAAEEGGLSENYTWAQELTADQVAWRSWNGGSWGWDSGDKFVLSAHQWNPLSKYVRTIWESAWQAVGLCNNFIEDIKDIDPKTLGITEEKKNAYIAEVRAFRAYCYYNVFEVYGSTIPLTESIDTKDLPASAMAGMTFEEGNKKVCDWMLKELDETLSLLPKKGEQGYSVNRCSQAMNRVLKMRILLNSKLWTGEDKFAECKTLAKEIIDGKYGSYSIAEKWQDIYSWNNDTNCDELIFAWSSDEVYNRNYVNMRSLPFLAYTSMSFFNSVMPQGTGAWNCTMISPSFDNSANFYDQCVEVSLDEDGKTKIYTVVKDMYDRSSAVCFLDAPYGDKLGAVHERFDPRDNRLVAPYNDGAEEWGGIFLDGVMRTDYGRGTVIEADADRKKQPLVYVDQIGNFQNKGNHTLQIVENPRWGETNSGIRLSKYPWYSTTSGHYESDPDEVEYRLAEVYYTYAECLLREGNSAEAKEWVNKVRRRYFTEEDWNNGTTTADGRTLVGAKDQAPRGFDDAFDMDRMLSEWGLEYLAEGRRRRTDLRRFDKFTQGQWWFFGRTTETGYDLPAKRDRKYEWFPLPQTALTSNPNLIQNPYYVD